VAAGELADAAGELGVPEVLALEVLELDVLEHATRAAVAMTASATPAARRFRGRRRNTGILSGGS
jgi:hypothetical protein